MGYPVCLKSTADRLSIRERVVKKGFNMTDTNEGSQTATLFPVAGVKRK